MAQAISKTLSQTKIHVHVVPCLVLQTYNYWGYQHGYPSDGYYRTSQWYYTTTQWYYTSTTDYYGEVDISVSHGSHSGIVGGKDNHEFRLICDSLHSGGKMYRVSGGVNVDTRLTAITINPYYFKDLLQLTLKVVLCD